LAFRTGLPPGSSCGSSAAGHEAPIRSCRQRTLQAWLAARHAVRSGHRASSMNRLAVAVTHLIGAAHAGSVVAALPVLDPGPCNHDFKRQRWFRSAARRYYRLWQTFVAPEAMSVRPDRPIRSARQDPRHVCRASRLTRLPLQRVSGAVEASGPRSGWTRNPELTHASLSLRALRLGERPQR